MDQRFATSPEHVAEMGTDELRSRFLVSDLFADDEAKAVYTHHDRIVLVGVQPVAGPVTLPTFEQIRSEFFFEHREGGIINVGSSGSVSVDGTTHAMAHGSCLYVGRGAISVIFSSDDAQASQGPACFYIVSAPAHTAYPTAFVEAGQGNIRELGDALASNRRTINQYIHEGGIRSCQVVMGVTTLHPGSMWNTMPAHTHDRRTEAYLYFGLAQEARIIHIMGEPQETRHLVVADRQAVVSPSWSVHCGVGTSNYSFVWAMAGENQSFDDMDGFAISDMR